MKKIYCLALALMLLAPLVFSAGNYDELISYLGAALPLAAVLLTTGVIIAGIVYALGNALSNDKMKAWAKTEIFEILFSAIILSTVLFAVFSFDQVVNYIATSPNIAHDSIASGVCSTKLSLPQYKSIPFCHIKLAIYFLNSLFNELKGMGEKVYLKYLVTSTMADFSINIEIATEMAGFFTFNPLRGFFSIDNIILNELFEYITRIMVVTKLQEVFIAFISIALFPILLTMGLVMRSFAFTRRLGGLLAALAIALFFVYPMFYVFGAFSIDNIKLAIFNSPEYKGKFTNPEKVPVADYLYINGSLPLIGGGAVDLGKESAAELDKLNDPDADKDLASQVGSVCKPDPSNPGNCLPGTGFMPDVNLLKKADFNDPATEAARSSAAKKAFDYVKNVFAGRNYKSDFVVNAFEEGGLVDAVAKLSFFSLFFAMFGILATIAAIRSLSITLGGDIEIAGLTHLI
jgi:hypothetical protein